MVLGQKYWIYMFLAQHTVLVRRDAYHFSEVEKVLPLPSRN